MNPSERGSVASRIDNLSESWGPSCVGYAGEMESSLKVLATAVDATVDGLPYPPRMLTGDGYLIAISRFTHHFNYPGFIAPEPDPPLTFNDVDPSGRLHALADSQDEHLRENPWLFTASETANDGVP